MKFFPAIGLGLAVCLPIFNPSEALAITLNWTGDGGYFLTGSFTESDINNDGFIRANNANPNEITTINISFFRPDNSLLVTYDTLAIKSDPNFNFNYQISSNKILQNGTFNSINGFTLGDSINGYSLDSSNGLKLFFSDLNFGIDFDQGGVLTASPVAVPFEFNPQSGLVIFTTLWVGHILRKKLRNKP